MATFDINIAPSEGSTTLRHVIDWIKGSGIVIAKQGTFGSAIYGTIATPGQQRIDIADSVGNIYRLWARLAVGQPVDFATVTYFQAISFLAGGVFRFNGVVTNPAVFYKTGTGIDVSFAVVANPANPSGRASSQPVNSTVINDGISLTYLALTQQYFFETTAIPEINEEDEQHTYYKEGINPLYQYQCYWSITQCITSMYGYYEVQFINNEVFLHVCGPRYEYKTEQLTEIVEVPGGGLPDTMQITNSAGQVVDFDFSGIEQKLDALVKDASFTAFVENQSAPIDYTDLIQDFIDAFDLKQMYKDYTGQFNETNRQLSLIDSRLYEEDAQGVITTITNKMGSSGGFDGVLKDSNGDPIDIKVLLENIAEGIASGAILAGDKWEPIRGFFSMLKEKWSA